MEFICKLKDLLTLTNNVNLAISSKPKAMPILEGIMLTCKENKLTLTGYDLSLGIIKSLDVNGIEEGAIVLKSQIFLDILKKTTDEKIHIKVDNKLITIIEFESSNFKLVGLDPQNYPTVPNINKENHENILIKESVLKGSIFKTLFAVSINQLQNPIFCGVLFEAEKDKLEMVALDGYRVAISRCEIKNIDKKYSFVVSSKTLTEIYKLLSEDEEKTTEIKIDKSHIVFNIDGYYIVSRLLEGNFLDYKATIPQKNITTVEIDPMVLEKSIERVSIMVTQKSSIILKIQEDIIYLNCESSLGSAAETIKTKINGEPLEQIAFNNKFMLDALKHCQCEKVKISFSGEVMPIKIESTAGDDFLYLVLPIRLR